MMKRIILASACIAMMLCGCSATGTDAGEETEDAAVAAPATYCTRYIDSYTDADGNVFSAMWVECDDAEALETGTGD